MTTRARRETLAARRQAIRDGVAAAVGERMAAAREAQHDKWPKTAELTEELLEYLMPLEAP